MDRKIKKLAAGLLLLVMIVTAVPGQLLVSHAATGKITFSDPSVTVGNQVSVTMKITSTSGEGLGASDVMLEYDSSKLEFVSGTSANGGAGSVRILGTMESEGQTSFSFTMKFKALQAGSTSIKVKSQEVYDSNAQAVTIDHVGSSAVKVNAPATYSKEASLSSLKISPGELNPAFSPDVTSYTASVGKDVTKVTVSAPAKDSKAKVVINGNDDLQMGENTVVCKVTAEDGETVKSYTITVTKSEAAQTDDPPGDGSVEANANAQGSGMDVTVREKSYQVAASFDAAALPEGFTSSQAQYNGVSVAAGRSDEKDITLLYLTGESGDSGFFIYNEEKGTFAPYVTVNMAEKSVVVLPIEDMPEDVKIPEEFAVCSIDIGAYAVQGWIWKTEGDALPEYCVVYGMNKDGESGLYRYDQKEMTLQRYFQDPAAESTKAKLVSVAEEYNSLLEDYSIRGWIIAALFAICIVLVIILLVLLLGKKPRTPDRYDDYGPRDRAKPSKSKGSARRSGRSWEDDYGDFEEDSRENGIEDLDDNFDDVPVRSSRPAAGAPSRPAAGASSRPAAGASSRPAAGSPSRPAAGAPSRPAAGVSSRPVTGAPRPASPKSAPRSVEDVERDIAAGLAKEANRAVTERKPADDDDDFEFIDLDL